eukprot:m.228085 g.228085  ORF g.228085 m.228085 type:complete len:58 (-) comp26420_c0_seq26:162-335(-)
MAQTTSLFAVVRGWMEMLINVSEDPFDMHDIKKENPDIVSELRPYLPPTYAEGCSQQ